jgi:hypothetical protein
VTRVASHNALGRIGVDLETQTAVERRMLDHLRSTRPASVTDHRVFSYELAASSQVSPALTDPDSGG